MKHLERQDLIEKSYELLGIIESIIYETRYDYTAMKEIRDRIHSFNLYIRHHPVKE